MPETKIPESILDNARTDARLAIIGEVTKLYERLAAAGLTNQSRIAERLGVSRQYISRLLSGPESNNWTLNKIGELLAAMDAAIARVEMRPVSELSPPNMFHEWLEPKIGHWRVDHHPRAHRAPLPPRENAETEQPLAPRVRVDRLESSIDAMRTSGELP